MTLTQNENFWCVIPAGGIGSRLWPLSRADEPKFLLDLTGSGKSLLAATWERLQPLAPADRTVVVTGISHRASVWQQIPDLLPQNLLTEPEPKDSSAAIGLAAAIIERRNPQAIIGSFAADHVIGNQFLFNRAVTTAIKAAETGAIVTIGIRPSHPSTAFGYIQTGEPRGDIAPLDVFAVQKFVEKPDLATAERYLAAGDRLWNAGMFISRADVLLSQLTEAEPEMVEMLRELAAAWDTPNAAAMREKIWPKLPKVAIDYTVAEPAAKAGRMLCVAAHFAWDDVGDFASVANLLSRGRKHDLAVLGDGAQVLSESSSGIVVAQPGRLVTVVGVSDIVIVDTPDVLLVTDKKHAQDVKNLVARVRNIGKNDLL
ncbi:MAG: mannose-1-phosphate guanylyltransferase [Microbacteriaceae bacterium]|nr:mannose-1-phosphate guanylyltransferase [Microbacteriaceae bacterium]